MSVNQDENGLSQVPRFLLDGNCFNVLLDRPDFLQNISNAASLGIIELIGTHVEADEISATRRRDENLARQLLDAREQLKLKIVPSSGFIVGTSKVGEAKIFGDQEAADFEVLRNRNIKHTEDSLLVTTAVSHSATIVTEEKKRLRTIAKANGLKVLFVEELNELCRQLLN